MGLESVAVVDFQQAETVTTELNFPAAAATTNSPSGGVPPGQATLLAQQSRPMTTADLCHHRSDEVHWYNANPRLTASPRQP